MPVEIEKPLFPEIIVDFEISNKSVDLMNHNESPLKVLENSYSECYPAFDRDFLIIFSQYYCKNGPDCDYLLEKIVFSNKRNAIQIATLGILDSLYIKLPNTFEIILKIMEANPLFINYFLNSGGLFLLAYFSDNVDFQLIIAHIFLFITDSSQCRINSEISLLPPSCFGTYFDNQPRLTYEIFLETLLFSENEEVQITCLKAIEKLFGEGRNEVQSLEIIIIDILNKLIADTENEHLLPYILQTAYEFDVGTFSREFIIKCHDIFQNGFEPAIKPALYFISKNMEFICANEETSNFIFEDLFLLIEKGLFKVTRLATFDLISFMSICDNVFYEPSFKKGLFQCISNIFLTFDPTIEEEIDFKFVITMLKNFLKKLIKNEYQIEYEDRDSDLTQLIESLQPFLSYAYDKIARLAKRCINLSSRLNGINTEEEDVSEGFGERIVVNENERNDFDGHDFI